MEVHGTESIKSNALLEPYECFRFHEDIKTRQSAPIQTLANIAVLAATIFSNLRELYNTKIVTLLPILFFLSHKVYVFYGMFKG